MLRCCFFFIFFFFLLCRKDQWVDGQIQAQVPGLGSGAIPQRKWRSVCGYAEGTRQCKWLLCAVDCVKHHKLCHAPKKYKMIYYLYLMEFNSNTSYADSTSSMCHRYYFVVAQWKQRNFHFIKISTYKNDSNSELLKHFKPNTPALNTEESCFILIFQIATNRRMTVKYNPPSSCILEISVKGIKLSVQEDYYSCDGVRLLLFLRLMKAK